MENTRESVWQDAWNMAGTLNIKFVSLNTNQNISRALQFYP